MKKLYVLVGLLLLVALTLTACGGEGETVEVTRIVEVTRVVQAEGAAEPEAVTFAGAGNTLAAVQARGILNCGSNASLPGFANLEADGSYTGFDYDFCRVVAAAALGDADSVEVRATTATERFPVLQSGEVDVLIRNTTWTISRDTSLGFDFAPVTFYDGQGMMVRDTSGITTLEDFEGGSVCVQAGTTTERNLADWLRRLGIDQSTETIVFPDNPSTTAAYDEGRCDGLTTDKSGLAAVRTQTSNPDEHVILDVTMSKEPLGPVVRHGDNNWGDVVMWAVNCTIEAEELGITSENVDEFLGSENPDVLRLLGVEGDLGQAMGLANDFCVQIIRQVGNYAEIYDRNLGPDTGVFIPRGLNSLYTEGGLLYSPPFR